MIFSDKQMHVSRAALAKLEAALDTIRSRSESPEWVRQIEIDALESQIQDIRADMARYENLRAGQIEFPETCSLEELPTRLIEIRIASNLTQTELAGILGLKPQQIQRYEASRYSGASLARLTNVAKTLLYGKEMPIKLGDLERIDGIKPSACQKDALDLSQNEWPKKPSASIPMSPVSRSRDLRWKPKHALNLMRNAR
jgi:transcriptional regulator with XRE-family HTH domain